MRIQEKYYMDSYWARVQDWGAILLLPCWLVSTWVFGFLGMHFAVTPSISCWVSSSLELLQMDWRYDQWLIGKWGNFWKFYSNFVRPTLIGCTKVVAALWIVSLREAINTAQSPCRLAQGYRFNEAQSYLYNPETANQICMIIVSIHLLGSKVKLADKKQHPQIMALFASTPILFCKFKDSLIVYSPFQMSFPLPTPPTTIWNFMFLFL